MILPDVNILINAHRKDASDHVRYRNWLRELLNGPEAYAMSELVLSGVLRIVTNPRIYKVPTSMADALTFVDDVRNQDHCSVLAPGPRHWEIFTHLCVASGARADLVPDAYFAALAIETGSEWITEDGDYGRFPGLRWRRPF